MAHEHEAGELAARIANLERWQRDQNGALRRLEAKVDKLADRLVASLAAALIAACGVIVQLIIRVH